MKKINVFLNGKILPINQAKISVLDRGFLFGEGVYEVLLYDKAMVGYNLHLQRLKASLAHMGMLDFFDNYGWKDSIQKMIDANDLGDRFGIYLHITRGFDKVRSHDINPDFTPTIFIMPMKLGSNKTKINSGVKTILIKDSRRMFNFVKSTSLLENVILKNKASTHCAEESLLHRNGKVVEGSSSNIFILKNNSLITPPTDGSILPGVTRWIVMQLAIKLNYKLEQREITTQELMDADEAFITSSTREILPIVQIDESKINDGKVGDGFKKIFSSYQSNKLTDFDISGFCEI
jgi:D-alanine transaminase